MEDKTVATEVENLKLALKSCHFNYVKQQLTLLNALKHRFGPEVADIVEKVNGEELYKAYLANKENGERTIKDFITAIWEPLREQGYVFTMEENEKGLQMNCTVCPLARLYNALGGADWGYRLFCATDEFLVKEFNPQIGFKRTKTLMEGNECCDHFYYTSIGEK